MKSWCGPSAARSSSTASRSAAPRPTSAPCRWPATTGSRRASRPSTRSSRSRAATTAGRRAPSPSAGCPTWWRRPDLHVPGFAKVAPPYPYRDRGRGTDEELVQRRARELRQAIVAEGPETVSAVIMEPVISSGGFIMPPIGWLRAVRAICDDLEVLMIADEVITGFGRTGRWFACEHDGVVPDLMTVAKGITSGYIPLSAAIARRRLADAFPD